MIRGHLRPCEVIKGQSSKSAYYMFFKAVGGKYVVPILALVIQGHKDVVVLCRRSEAGGVKRAA